MGEGNDEGVEGFVIQDFDDMDLIQVGVSVTGSKKNFSSVSVPGRARHGPCSCSGRPIFPTFVHDRQTQIRRRDQV